MKKFKVGDTIVDIHDDEEFVIKKIYSVFNTPHYSIEGETRHELGEEVIQEYFEVKKIITTKEINKQCLKERYDNN